MSRRRDMHIRTAILIFVIALCMQAVKARAFTTAGEFLSHGEGVSGCISGECHAPFSDELPFPHEPVLKGECTACHQASAYPARFGLLSDQSAMCAQCHKGLDEVIRSSEFVHGPIKNGDCSSCHNPHGGERPAYLRNEYGILCSSCHNIKRMFSGEFMHKPVKDGNCVLCHDPHASNFKSRLTDAGTSLCLTCHQDMVAGMTSAFIHEPLIQSGCSSCHDPHSGDNLLRLRVSADKLCFECHTEKKNELSHYVKRHEPAEKGQCTVCHSPHFSESPSLVRGRTDELCYGCHEEARKQRERRFLHGPVVQGNCSACHNPHGSDNAFILRLAFPHSFYAPYKEGEYDLCLLCHKAALITEETTATATNFRNGTKNLHRLHVYQKKGRTCRACHDVHASNHESRIRDEFAFGKVMIPMYYSQTENGGKCTPGCHRERIYDRVNAFDNKR